MNLGSSDGTRSREIADGHFVSLEATDGQKARLIVRDHSGNLLDAFKLVATDAQGSDVLDLLRAR